MATIEQVNMCRSLAYRPVHAISNKNKIKGVRFDVISSLSRCGRGLGLPTSLPHIDSRTYLRTLKSAKLSESNQLRESNCKFDISS